MWRKGVWRATATPRLQMSCYSFILNIVLLLCLAFSFYFTSCKHYKCRPSSITTNGNKHFHTTKEFYEVDENVNLLNYQDKKSYSKNSVYQKKIFKQISLKQKIYPDLNECQTRPLRPLYYQRGQYWVLENYIPADRSFLCNQSITYTTHGDYTFLGNLELLISRWQGPVSMALYAPDADFEYTLDILVYLRNCRSQDIKTYVTFHIFFDVLHTPKVPPTNEVLRRKSICNRQLPDLSKLTTYRLQQGLLYPVNVARNAARLAAQTYFVIPSDVDFYPSTDIIPEFFKMLQEPDVSSTTKPRVYIFPTFKEEKNIDELPASKVTLKELVLAETVIPLYNEMCTTCENSSFAQEWIEHSGESGLSVFHVGQGSTAYDKWEPIYIGTNSEPIYDEMLSLEGKREKIVQMYTLCLKGYEFHVLDNAFLVYRPGSTKHKLWHRDMFVAEQYTFIKEELIPRYLTMFKEDEKCYI